jgi:hypothetical protein
VKPTRTGPLLLVALAVAVIGAAALRVWLGWGRTLPVLPLATLPVLLVLAAAIVAGGWPVRRWQRGNRERPLDPLRAARTAVLAKAAQPAAALLVGGYLAQALVVLAGPQLRANAIRLALRPAIVALGAVAVWVAGWLVESWCRVDDWEQPPDPAA